MQGMQPDFNEDDFIEKPVRRERERRDHSNRENRKSRNHRYRSRSPQSDHHTRREYHERKIRSSQVSRPGHRSAEDDDDYDDDDIGPQLPSTVSQSTNTRFEYERDLSRRHESQHHQRLLDKRDRNRERSRRTDVLEELVPRPDPGRPAKLAASALRSQQQQQQQSSFRGHEDGLGVDIFAEDGLKERMKRDQERREERDRVKRLKALERDEEKLGRISKMKEKEASNMEILKRLAEKRFGI